MKKIILALAFLAGSTAVIASGDEGKTEMAVNTSESQIEWIGKKVTGEHQGTFSLKSGTLNIEDGMIQSANLIIDMTSIMVTDEGMDDETKGKLKGHLSSPDFFNIPEHNTAAFQLTTFKPMKGENGANYEISVKLTIKGITQDISFPAKVDMTKGSVSATGSLVIDRSKWDIRYGSGSFFDDLGDKVIYDDVEINFNLVASK